MPVRIVQSKQNARLKQLRRALGAPGRKAEGLAGIEGPNLLEEALRSGLRIECVFAAEGSERLLDPLHLPADLEVLLVPKEILDSALSTETPQPIAALVEPPDWTWAHILPHGTAGASASTRLARMGWESSPLLLVLAGLQDPGNLGTILRSAEAFGATGVISLPGTVSAWNPKAVRASAGSVFRVPLLEASATECLMRLREAGVTALTTVLRSGEPANAAGLARPVALLIGNEGKGVPEDLAAQADASITIPCPGPVESLNAAVAAGILLYEAARQRSLPSGGPPDHRGGRR